MATNAASAVPAVPPAAPGYLDAEGMMRAELRRWCAGSAAPLHREPLAPDTLGRWVSLGDMTPPTVSVSLISWMPKKGAGE